MGKRIVIALGGNALGSTPEEQLQLVKNTAKSIVDLIEAGNKVIITHGNGPQVGMINLAMEVSSEHSGSSIMPFAECGAMSQGYIGYHLQQSIQRELNKRKMRRSCVTLVTQVEVSKDDPGFKNPTKPIGKFYTKEEADKLHETAGYTMKEDAGRGYRRVVASPLPVKIVEINIIKKLLDAGNVVISCGGGGIPVVKDRYGYKGVDAVIDKDRTSSKLACSLQADVLLILTAVDEVSINFNKPNQEKIKKMTVKQAGEYIKNGEFVPGSMLPKIEACIDFAKYSKKGYAMITSLKKALNALEGKSGTIIKK